MKINPIQIKLKFKKCAIILIDVTCDKLSFVSGEEKRIHFAQLVKQIVFLQLNAADLASSGDQCQEKQLV